MVAMYALLADILFHMLFMSVIAKGSLVFQKVTIILYVALPIVCE